MHLVFFLQIINQLIHNWIAGDAHLPYGFADKADGKIKVQPGVQKLLDLVP